MIQARALMRTILPQAGPGTPADVELRVAQKIGRQLAEIGDELNRHYLNASPNPWLLPILRAGHAHRLARNHMRRLVGHQQPMSRPGEMWAWLTSLLHRKLVREECRGSWVKVSVGLANRYSWAAGMLVAALLATAVAWISL